MRGGSAFPPSQRLRSGEDFRRVLEKGLRLPGPLFVLVGLPNALGRDRLGLTVSRRVGTAVARNRSRRLVRESFRRKGAPARPRPGLDFVVLAARTLADCGQGAVDHELANRIRRLEQRLAPERRQDPPPPDRGL